MAWRELCSWKRGLAVLGLLAVVGVTVYTGATLPPRAIALNTEVPPTVVFGGYHIHTERSDGAWSVDEVAAAAARAGLHFIVLTDHGDGTRTPDPPAYRRGVLVIDAVEISTADGHVVALNLDKPSPYPLAGRGRDVIEDIHRLGGWAVVAHPDSPKPELRWRAWDSAYDGVEWLNVDSEWRDESKVRLAASALRAMVRGPESIAALFKRPDATISRWADELKRRPVVALGAMDAHGSFPLGSAVLKTVWQAAQLDAPLTGQAGADTRQLLEAMRRGRTFTIIPAIAGPAVLEFTATRSGITVRSGERIDGVSQPVTFQASVPGVLNAHVELVRDNHPSPIQFKDAPGLAWGKESLTYAGIPYPGSYHAEATLNQRLPWYVPSDGKPFIHVGPPPPRYLPWLFSNSVYIDGLSELPPQPTLPLDVSEPGRMGVRTALPLDRGWRIEHAAGSGGEVAAEADGLRFGFRLGVQTTANPFAALVTDVDHSQSPIRRLEFVGRADRPTRLSIQVRVPDGSRDGQRWGRSIYLDETARTFAVSIEEFEPIGGARPQLLGSAIRSLLFVADTVNVAPGSRGTVWLSSPALWTMVPR